MAVEHLTAFTGKELMKLLGYDTYPTKPKVELAEIILKKLAFGMDDHDQASSKPNADAASPKRKHAELDTSATTTLGASAAAAPAKVNNIPVSTDPNANCCTEDTPQQKRSRKLEITPASVGVGAS